MATTYNYKKNSSELDNNIASAGLSPTSVSLVASANVVFASPISVDDKVNLDQALLDSGYDYDSTTTGDGGSFITLEGQATAPGASPSGDAWVWFDSTSGELKASLSGGAPVSIVTSSGGTIDLQDAYDNGATINLAGGVPVTLNKSSVDASSALSIAVSDGTGAGMSIALTGSATGPAATFTGGDVGVSTTTPHSRFHVDGSFAMGFRAVSTNAVALATDAVISADASGGAITITLPTAVGIAGRTYYIKKIDSTFNFVYVQAAGAQTIDGTNTQRLSVQYETMQIVSTGAGWLKI